MMTRTKLMMKMAKEEVEKEKEKVMFWRYTVMEEVHVVGLSHM